VHEGKIFKQVKFSSGICTVSSESQAFNMMMEFMDMMDESESTQVSILESPHVRRRDDLLQVLLGDTNNAPTREVLVKFPQDPRLLSVVVDVVINREDITEEDHAALWFSNQDFNELKAEARMESMACEGDGSAKLLDGVFVEKSKISQASIIQWVHPSDGGRERRGLERMANQRLANIRQRAQFQAIMDVLRAQDELKIGRGHVDHEAVRKVSEKATRVARHFARMIGKADAHAVNELNLTSNHDREHSTKRISSGGKSSSSSKRLSDGINSVASTKSNSQKDMKSNKKEKFKKDKDKSKDKDKDPKDKVKGKDKEKTRSTLKQKFKDTKAGIIARIPRIA
jgi:hypothetical protein